MAEKQNVLLTVSGGLFGYLGTHVYEALAFWNIGVVCMIP